jgi:hypothetical protein
VLHALILRSILIYLNANAAGELFQFIQGRHAMKATIDASAHEPRAVSRNLTPFSTTRGDGAAENP